VRINANSHNSVKREVGRTHPLGST